METTTTKNNDGNGLRETQQRLVLSTAMPGDFTVQLGQNNECAGECQAYLLEATIPFTWHNVHADDCLVITDSGTEHHLTLTPAYYESVSSLVSEMNKAFKTLKQGTIAITVYHIARRVSIDCGTSTISGSLLLLLGWPAGAKLTGKQQAPQTAYITCGVHSVYMYLDCIEPTNAGSFQVPLIEKVPIGNFKPGDIIQYRQALPVETPSQHDVAPTNCRQC